MNRQGDERTAGWAGREMSGQRDASGSKGVDEQGDGQAGR